MIVHHQMFSFPLERIGTEKWAELLQINESHQECALERKRQRITFKLMENVTATIKNKRATVWFSMCVNPPSTLSEHSRAMLTQLMVTVLMTTDVRTPALLITTKHPLP